MSNFLNFDDSGDNNTKQYCQNQYTKAGAEMSQLVKCLQVLYEILVNWHSGWYWMLATIITTIIKLITEHSPIKHFSRNKATPRYVSIKNHNFTDKKTHWHLFSSSLPLIQRPKGNLF